MKKKTVSRILTTVFSSAMIVAQMGAPISVMAADGDTADGVSEEEVLEYDETEEVEEDFIDIEAEDAAEYDDSELIQITEDELVPPTDLKWEAPGVFSFKVASELSMIYEAEVYYEGDQYCGGFQSGDESCNFGKTVTYDILSGDFEKTGNYTLKMYVRTDDSRDAQILYSPEEPQIYWKCPEQRIDTPTNMRWEKSDDEHFAIITCDPIEHASWYHFDLYEDDTWCAGVSTPKNNSDFSAKIGDLSEHNYYVIAQAYSDDLLLYANSETSENSPYLTANSSMINTQKDIVELGKNVNASNIDEKVQQVKEIENATLKASLQTSDAALEAMGKIENEYKDAKGINVLPATSDVAKIPASQIEMTGAALNVSNGTVQLNVKDQTENGSDLINTDIYTNIIAFDMSVNSSEGIDFSKELEVPVTISMPIPSGMNTSVMVILHYRADGTEELITPRIENGKAIFAITHFSTFAFAEKKDSSSNAGLGNTFSKADAVAGVTAYDETHTLKIDTANDGYFTSAKILKADGTVDTSVNSYIANIVTEYNADGSPKTFYSLIFRNGIWDTTYDTVKDGLYEFQGEQYSIAGGTVNLNVNSLTFTGDIDGWKYIILGHVVKNHAGLVAYGPADDLHWFWIDNEGGCDTEYNAIVKWNGADFLVHGGRLRTDYTGFTYDPQNESVWYHITAGQVWGDGEITDQSIAGGYLTCNVENGVVKEMKQAPNNSAEENNDGYLVLGFYEQDGNLGNGKEPIEWQILGTNEKGTLVISRYVLDGILYPDAYKWYEALYNQAFSAEEKTMINPYNDNGKKISSISEQEMTEFCDFNYYVYNGPISYAMGTGGTTAFSEGLITPPTKFAEFQGLKSSSISQEMYDEKYADYGYGTESMNKLGTAWLAGIWFVSDEGAYTPNGVLNMSYYNGRKIGVRPVMYLNQ